MARSKGSVVKDHQVSANELNNAEHVLVKSIQDEAFAHEIAYLTSKPNS